MMPRYVDADALIVEREEEIVDYDEDLQKHFMIKAVPTEYIEDFPTADVEEVKHGEWVEDSMIGEGVYRCTNCDDKFVTLEGTPYDNRLFYCPFCGAKMNGKEQRNGQD